MADDRRKDDDLRKAFQAVHDGFSADRIIVDPQLNQLFIAECRRRGLDGNPSDFNRGLMNLRKRSGLAGIETSKNTSFKNDDDYRFASEMSARFLERRDELTLDDILCDPDLAVEFDSVCVRIAPGYTSLEYRWAALRLRKSRRLSPEQLAHLMPSESVEIVMVDEINLEQMPRQAGLYLFFTADESLYAGETANLRKRLAKHLDHSDNKGLARWMWEFGSAALYLEIHHLGGNPSSRVRRALEGELIRSRRPLFNSLGSIRSSEKER